jgi:hypothetical protein
MKDISIVEAMRTLSTNRLSRRFPNKSDPRYDADANIIFPNTRPKFPLDFKGANSVFAIGSCFARNIEDALEPLGVSLPTKQFVAPKEEWPHRPNGLLNEYNPGSISQRILSTLEGASTSEGTIYKHADVYHDLLLCGGNGVGYARAIARRQEIAEVYTKLISSEIVIITLGFIECWYDQETKSWLNRMPPVYGKDELNEPERLVGDLKRFVFRRLDVFDAMPLLSKALDALDSLNQKIILTVSPVPMATTMTPRDCVVANEYSKAVLRVCAERLSQDFKNVDYYPSYEIVRSAGLGAYGIDNIHVKDELVSQITENMIDAYQGTLK